MSLYSNNKQYIIVINKKILIIWSSTLKIDIPSLYSESIIQKINIQTRIKQPIFIIPTTLRISMYILSNKSHVFEILVFKQKIRSA